MNMIKADKENNIFGALKLIEQLYLDGEIPGHVYVFIYFSPPTVYQRNEHIRFIIGFNPPNEA